ncbi:MAG: putative toxin-antitoxin system toxin component, PIN family [Burkholderiaceae bacterium]
MRTPGALVVIDTNVWISGLISMVGPPGQLTRRVIRNGQPVFTASTFDELKERLWRPKFDRYVSMEQRQALLENLDAAARWVKVTPEIAARTFCRDPDDDKFIHAALSAQPVWLITGDKDLLVLTETLLPQGVRILSPADAVASPAFL